MSSCPAWVARIWSTNCDKNEKDLRRFSCPGTQMQQLLRMQRSALVQSCKESRFRPNRWREKLAKFNRTQSTQTARAWQRGTLDSSNALAGPRRVVEHRKDPQMDAPLFLFLSSAHLLFL